MLDNEKRRALKEMEEDLNEIRESLKQRFIEETDSDRFSEICRRIYEIKEVKYNLECVREFFEQLYFDRSQVEATEEKA